MNSKLAIEKLDRIYRCTQCDEAFLFKSDVDDHKETTGHGNMQVVPFG